MNIATFRKAILAILAGLVITAGALALDLSEAKESGLVGETDSGYLASVTAPSEEVSTLIKDINLKRRAEYQAIARKNNIAVSDVELLAGKKAIEKTPAGQYVLVEGKWLKK